MLNALTGSKVKTNNSCGDLLLWRSVNFEYYILIFTIFIGLTDHRQEFNISQLKENIKKIVKNIAFKILQSNFDTLINCRMSYQGDKKIF